MFKYCFHNPQKILDKKRWCTKIASRGHSGIVSCISLTRTAPLDVLLFGIKLSNKNILIRANAGHCGSFQGHYRWLWLVPGALPLVMVGSRGTTVGYGCFIAVGSRVAGRSWVKACCISFAIKQKCILKLFSVTYLMRMLKQCYIGDGKLYQVSMNYFESYLSIYVLQIIIYIMLSPLLFIRNVRFDFLLFLKANKFKVGSRVDGRRGHTMAYLGMICLNFKDDLTFSRCSPFVFSEFIFL